MKKINLTLLVLFTSVIALAFLLQSSTTAEPASENTVPKPQLIDSTLEYLRYTVELSDILEDKFSNPALQEFARYIKEENQEHTRKLVSLIIDRGWSADYDLPDEMKRKIRQAQIYSGEKAGDFYFQEIQQQINELTSFYQCKSLPNPQNNSAFDLMEMIIKQQFQFSKDITDIVQIRRQAYNN